MKFILVNLRYFDAELFAHTATIYSTMQHTNLLSKKKVSLSCPKIISDSNRFVFLFLRYNLRQIKVCHLFIILYSLINLNLFGNDNVLKSRNCWLEKKYIYTYIVFRLKQVESIPKQAMPQQLSKLFQSLVNFNLGKFLS